MEGFTGASPCGVKMKVYIEKEDKHVEYDKPCTAAELCAEIGVNPTTVLIVKNGEVILEDTPLETSDEIKLLSVVSGG